MLDLTDDVISVILSYLDLKHVIYMFKTNKINWSKRYIYSVDWTLLINNTITRDNTLYGFCKMCGQDKELEEPGLCYPCWCNQMAEKYQSSDSE